MADQAWPVALAGRPVEWDKGQVAAVLGRWKASILAIPGTDMLFSCREIGLGQDERGGGLLSPGPARVWLVTVSLPVLPGAQQSLSLEGQEGSHEAMLGLGGRVGFHHGGCVCESLLFLESKVTAGWERGPETFRLLFRLEWDMVNTD